MMNKSLLTPFDKWMRRQYPNIAYNSEQYFQMQDAYDEGFGKGEVTGHSEGYSQGRSDTMEGGV